MKDLTQYIQIGDMVELNYDEITIIRYHPKQNCFQCALSPEDPGETTGSLQEDMEWKRTRIMIPAYVHPFYIEHSYRWFIQEAANQDGEVSNHEQLMVSVKSYPEDEVPFNMYYIKKKEDFDTTGVYYLIGTVKGIKTLTQTAIKVLAKDQVGHSYKGDKFKGEKIQGKVLRMYRKPVGKIHYISTNTGQTHMNKTTFVVVADKNGFQSTFSLVHLKKIK